MQREWIVVPLCPSIATLASAKDLAREFYGRLSGICVCNSRGVRRLWPTQSASWISRWDLRPTSLNLRT
jgi:hypothetical protein